MRRQAFTLVELVLVLAIVGSLAATVVPLLDEVMEIDGKSVEQIATEKTMRSLHEAIMGTPGRQGVWADLGQRPEHFPRSVDDLLLDAAPAYVDASMARFDPVTKTGWRGPYFAGAILDAWRRPLKIEFSKEDGSKAQLQSAGENPNDPSDDLVWVLRDSP